MSLSQIASPEVHSKVIFILSFKTCFFIYALARKSSRHMWNYFHWQWSLCHPSCIACTVWWTIAYINQCGFGGIVVLLLHTVPNHSALLCDSSILMGDFNAHRNSIWWFTLTSCSNEKHLVLLKLYTGSLQTTLY